MKKIKSIFLFTLLIILIITGCNPMNEDNIKNGKDNSKDTEMDNIELDNEEIDGIEEQIDLMSLDEKLGQLIIVGFEGTNSNEDLKYFINDLKVGGLIYFKRNIEDINQVINLNNSLRELNKDNDIPLFRSIDEEGGIVSRLSEEFGKLPRASDLGRLDNKDISFEYGEILGMRLKSLGFNLNYAPVIDINSNINNPVIGDRSFGNNPELVGKHGVEVKNGIESQNIISAVKHFPGHGDTSVDSHIGLPVIDKSLDEIRDFELIPFKKAVEDNVNMVMISHILFSQIDNEYPSTMSDGIMNNILRKELGFSGIIISDDLTMGAITKNYKLEEATLKFLQSGGDIGLICHGRDNPKIVLDYLKEAVANKELSIEDIDDKLYRILSLKEKFNLVDSIIEDINMEEINVKTKDLINRIN